MSKASEWAEEKPMTTLDQDLKIASEAEPECECWDCSICHSKLVFSWHFHPEKVKAYIKVARAAKTGSMTLIKEALEKLEKKI